MTGYGIGRASSGGVQCSVEMRTVNRKQLDVQLNMARELYPLEADIQRVIQSKLSRGRVNAEISVTYHGDIRKRSIKIDSELAELYVSKLKRTASKLGLENNLSVDLLLRIPDVVRREPPNVPVDLLTSVVFKAVESAVRNVTRTRSSEGRALAADLADRIKTLNSLLGAIRKKAPSIASSYREALMKRLDDARIPLDDKDGRIAREVALYADRCDVTEEITRLESHFVQATKLLKSNEASGRTLDFLAQEMFREINTIGSKANDRDIRGHVIDFKAELERFREQVQNVE